MKNVFLNYPDPSNVYSKMWKGVWKILAPSKIKIFMWRALHDALPTRAAIAHRLNHEDSCCKSCREKDESTLHMAALCPKEQEVWFISKLSLRLTYFNATSFRERWLLVWDLLKRETNSRNFISLALFTLWRIWKKRNDLIFNDISWTSEEVANKAEKDH
ncbi:hypothetical protein L6164_011681 [Bauhinia variegata]|uniref:Uncharacterized protein n=1 Tax=Bauhinia variegata TaxID=167791 RepID=A0ACB9P6U2_BAUVA|nr:hypothetical protein L6164_011681 [Bauhinia variegata]